MKRMRVIVSLLEGVANDEISTEEALRKWPNIDEEEDKLLTAAWHDLSHFQADSDIRARDEAYATYQRNLLTERAREIRERYRA